MRLCLLLLLSLLLISFTTKPLPKEPASITAIEAFQKLSDKLKSCQTISYQYFRSINYFSENYHSQASGTVYLDFTDTATAPGFRFQLENEQFKMVFNGTESFSLDKKKKTINITSRPKLNDFNSVSFFVNSPVTLKNALPSLINDKEVLMAVADTTINNQNFYLLSFVLKNKTLNGLGDVAPTSLQRQFVYHIVVDKESYLPLHVIQTNDAEPKDYVLTSFSNMDTNNNNIPSELSWYFSSYTGDYTPASAKTTALIKPNDIAPDWQLTYGEGNGTLALSHLKGKVILLEFWIKNCGHCIAAVPDLNVLAEKYKKEKFQLIGLNAHDTREGIRNFYDQNKPIFHTALDTNGTVTNQYGVSDFPTIVLLDKKGMVIYAGSFDQPKIDSLIQEELKNRF